MLPEVQEHLLIRSDKNITGFKGVTPNRDRYQARCNTPPCNHIHLGIFDTPEEAAQAYLHHYQKEHPEELKKKQAPPLRVQEHLLIRSDRAKSGDKGVVANGGRYHAQCFTPPCHHNHLGMFDTPEEAAQAYLQHYGKEHPDRVHGLYGSYTDGHPCTHLPGVFANESGGSERCSLVNFAKHCRSSGVTDSCRKVAGSPSVLVLKPNDPKTVSLENRLGRVGMLGDAVMHCQSVSVGMLKAHFFNYIAEGMSESKVFEMRLRSEILERDPKRFVSEEERREEVTQALLRARGFTLDRGGADWSLPDLISKEENKKCFELKCSNLLPGTHIGFNANTYGKEFDDGTFYIVWTVLIQEHDIGVVLGRDMTRDMYCEGGGLKCGGNLAGWDILGVFCLEMGDKHSLAACFT